MVNNFLKIAISLLSLLVIFLLVWFAFSIGKVSDKILHSIEKHNRDVTIEHAKKILDILDNKLFNGKNQIHSILKNRQDFRKICNETLQGLTSKEVPYVYILWFDKESKFRYLCDGSTQKAHFYQKFDPGDLDKWIKIYRGKKPVTIDQTRYKGLWKTILLPMVKNGKTEALLVIDYSTNFIKNIDQLISPLKTFLKLIFTTIVVLILLVLLEIIQIYLIRKKSYIEPLTKAYNRTFLNEISKKISISDYHILMIDLDYFKQINDLYGHLIGDKALKHVAHIIKKSIAKEDYFIRFGGEEFMILLRVSSKEPIMIAENLRKTLEQTPLKTKEFGNIILRASIGVHDTTKEEKDFQTAIKRADIALYQAKKAGRNCVKFVDNLSYERNIKYNFSYIKNLIYKGFVTCHFQPIISNRDGKIVKYEVLVRLKDEDNSLIYPNDFLPTIWKTNVYHQLTKQILEKSVAIFKNRDENFSINLSLQDVLNRDIIRIIEEVAKKEPEVIKKMGIEILEYDRFDDVKRLSSVMKRLKSYGISIILDDFGSGHANFSIVQMLDFDEIKIDGSLVEYINKNMKSKVLLETLANFANRTGLKTTVEYVSSKDIFESISKISFTNLQGFYIGKPKELG